MTTAHYFLGVASIALSVAVLGAAAWSALAARRSKGRVDHRFAVDRAVLAELILIAAAGLLGLALLVGGSHPGDPLHLLYGPAALVCVPVAILVGARGPAGRGSRLRRDTFTAAGAIILVGIGLRLFATG